MLDTIRWQVLLVALAGWENRQQLEVIAFGGEDPIDRSDRTFSEGEERNRICAHTSK